MGGWEGGKGAWGIVASIGRFKMICVYSMFPVKKTLTFVDHFVMFF